MYFAFVPASCFRVCSCLWTFSSKEPLTSVSTGCVFLLMDAPTRAPHFSGSGSGTLTPTNAPLKRSFDDLGSDDTVSVDGSGSSSAQASTNGDNDRNKRARSRSPLPVDDSDVDLVSARISKNGVGQR
jgi:hypothetical protein